MGKYEYNITKSVQQRIYSFYTNVAKKYPNTYDVANLLRDVESAYSFYHKENYRTQNQKIEALKEYKKSVIFEYVTGKKEVL